MRAISLIAIVVSFLFRAHTAFAGNPGGLTKPDAIAHFTKGNALYNAGDFAEAVQEYKAGMLSEPSAVFNYNLGQSYRQLGDYRQATYHYKRYLSSGLATPEEREGIEGVIAKMDAELQQKARTEPPTGPATNVSPMAPAMPPPTTRETRWYHDSIGWGATGVGVVGGAIAGVLFLQAADLRNDADAAATAGESQALDEKADTRARAGTYVAIGGGAFLAAGIIMLAIHPSPSQAAPQVSLGVSSNSLYVFGRF